MLIQIREPSLKNGAGPSYGPQLPNTSPLSKHLDIHFGGRIHLLIKSLFVIAKAHNEGFEIVRYRGMEIFFVPVWGD
jgi:hypothetical protein